VIKTGQEPAIKYQVKDLVADRGSEPGHKTLVEACGAGCQGPDPGAEDGFGRAYWTSQMNGTRPGTASCKGEPVTPGGHHAALETRRSKRKSGNDSVRRRPHFVVMRPTCIGKGTRGRPVH
jgi:hypothetical protein